MGISQFLINLANQADPRDKVSGEILLISEMMKIMAGDQSLALDHFISKAQAESDDETYNFLSNIKSACEELSEKQDGAFVPGTPANWAVAPTSVQEAIDMLAEKVSDGGVDPV
jgi:hypothetical protein